MQPPYPPSDDQCRRPRARLAAGDFGSPEIIASGLHYPREGRCPRPGAISIPGPYRSFRNWSPGRVRGHMVPTYFRELPGSSASTASVASHFDFGRLTLAVGIMDAAPSLLQRQICVPPRLRPAMLWGRSAEAGPKNCPARPADRDWRGHRRLRLFADPQRDRSGAADAQAGGLARSGAAGHQCARQIADLPRLVAQRSSGAGFARHP